MLENEGGVILNISSDLGVIAPDQRIYRKEGLPEEQQSVKPITYSAAKWAIVGMTKYLAIYFAKRNIRVNCLSPTGVANGYPEEFVSKLTNNIPKGRVALGYDKCLICGEKEAQQLVQKRRKQVGITYNKGGYQYITEMDLKSLGR